MNIADFKRRLIITGGAGFIGSNLLRYFVPKYLDTLFINIDCLTYAGNLASLRDLETADNYRFEKVSILDRAELARCFETYQPDGIIHLAAETHVDRSIESPADFLATNVTGTFHLLELARAAVAIRTFRFHHVSTDEVFGSIPEGERATEKSSYQPNSPYAASKAASDHLVRSYHVTYGLDTVISHCSNNYGPYQFPEKLIPLIIRNASEGLALPIYGDGRQVRDWLYVEDHCAALDAIFHRGRPGETYNVSSGAETENLTVVKALCDLLDRRLGDDRRSKLITLVADRPGHDRRYALDSGKIRMELTWRPGTGLEEGLQKTVDWYLTNRSWLQDCLSGEYLRYYERMYHKR
jgi:dTDP-glucose 4,6-dehydratase